MQTDVALATTSSRRKPSFTYKSPTATEWSTFSPRIPSPKSSSPIAPTPPSAPPAKIRERACKEKEKKAEGLSFKTPLLPLYHPHGRLALSLPPLDAASLGLPLLPLNYSESENGSGSRSSSRARHDRAAQSPGAHGIAVDVVQVVQEALAPGATTVSAVAAVAAREINEKEKASPRKRRMGGKRKRKDNDDGDPTYPAKRTRAPRGGHQGTAAEESGNEAEGGNADEGQDNDSSAETKKVERRRTRSRRTGGKRRSSSASQTPSPPVAEGAAHSNDDGISAADDISMERGDETKAMLGIPGREPVAEEKEEGELSDDGQA